MSKESVGKILEEALAEPDLTTMLEDISRFISRFIVLEPFQLTVISLWVAHTYVFHDAYTTPYLNIHSPEKRSGKTRLLEILETIVHKPWFTDRTSAAALCRKVEETKPTLLLDESDASFKSGGEYSETLRGILNGGFRASGKVTICVGQGSTLSYKDFSTYCPKAIAGIGKLPGTVADRSIPISMKRKRTGDRVHRFRRSNYVEDSDRIRESLHLWSQSTNCAEEDVSLPEELDDRQQD
ncbi:topoisomerase, partial [Dehalococcoidia bacterium]|nr:topoisomerase [Dehalococcoidia bacterium]